MALKSAQAEPGSAADIEERLELLDKALDRVKTLYEQYFLGIQKQPPSHLHTDVERKLRELTQIQIRNTALRYRFASVQSKFSSYNSYWRRTLRQIENGTYHRNLSKIGRQAAQTGAEVPEEILAAMPKRMREQVKRDRDAALALARLRDQLPAEPDELSLDDADLVDEEDASPAWISEPTELRRSMQAAREAAQQAAPPPKKDARGAHLLQEDDGDMDLDAFFASVTNEATPSPKPPVVAAQAPAGKRVGVVALDPPTVQTMPIARFHVERPSGPITPTAVAAAADGIPLPMDPIETGEIPVLAGPQGMTGPVRVPTGLIPRAQQTGGLPRMQQTGGLPRMQQTGAVPRIATPAIGVPSVIPPPQRTATPAPGIPVISPQRTATPAAGVPVPVGAQPSGPASRPTPMPIRVPMPARPSQKMQALEKPAPAPEPSQPFAPSQASRPNPIAPGASIGKSTPVESMAGPFPRAPITPSRPIERPEPPPKSVPVPAAKSAAPAPSKAPPGMTDADVNALYAKYVKAKEMIGEATGPGSYGKLLKTINAQAPKIMEQYKAKAVDFSVVVKDNQVIIRAKPKT